MFVHSVSEIYCELDEYSADPSSDCESQYFHDTDNGLYKGVILK